MTKSLVAELLEHLIVCGSSFAINTLFVPYGQSLGRSLREMEYQLDSCRHDFSQHSQKTVSATLSKLKRRGMVKTKGPKKKTAWLITKQGKAHFKMTNMGEDLPPKDGKIRLVIYDIPEEKSSYRAWLRHKLFVCDYTFLQKSVWLGTRPLPKVLLKELKERGLTSYVHVVGLEKFLDEVVDN